MITKALRFSARIYRRSPMVAAAAVLTVAVGFGLTAAVFGVIYGVLLRPLPYREPDRLSSIWEYNPGAGISKEQTSEANYVDWSKGNHVFHDLAAFTVRFPIETGSGDPRRIVAGLTTANFFNVLGVEPVVGRTFTAAEGQPGGNRVAVLSYRSWKGRFGGAANVLGSEIILDDAPYTVIGVMPAEFRHPDVDAGRDPVEMWTPLALEDKASERRSDYLNVIGRLKNGVSLERARIDMAAFGRQLQRQFPSDNAGYEIQTVSLSQDLVGSVKPQLSIVFGAVLFLLLLACANVATLLLAKSADRAHEFAIRTAIGASRRQLFVQFVNESLLLGLVGGALGWTLAAAGTEYLLRFASGMLPRMDHVNLSAPIFFCSVVVSLLGGLLFGALPALEVSRSNTNIHLREGGRGTAGGRTWKRYSSVLVLAQVTLAVMLVTGAALLSQSFVRMRHFDIGVRPSGVLTADIPLPWDKYPNDARTSGFFERLAQNVSSYPGVRSAAVSSALPLGGVAQGSSFHIKGRPWPSGLQPPDVREIEISPAYFGVLGIPLKHGRLINEFDLPNTQPVVVIGESLARKYWPNEDPVGKRIAVGVEKPTDANWLTVVGVVGDVRYFAVSERPDLQVYRPIRQRPWFRMYLLMKVNGIPASYAGAVRREVRNLDPKQAISVIETLPDVIDRSMARERFSILLVSIFGIIALILAAGGIYGIVSHSVAQRTRELGVRLALGARRSELTWMIVRQSMGPAIIGVCCGIGGALILARSFSSIVFGLSVYDPPTLAGSAVFVTIVAILACFVPALRVSRVDPIQCLAAE
jgi:putative ABC transport system permease protein